MHTRYYAQRLHLVQSVSTAWKLRVYYMTDYNLASQLDTLVHQLFTLSFLMSPSVFIYLSRMLVQIQCGRPREFDPTYPLRFFYGLILLCNAVIFWIHALQGASEGRGLVIDFIGMCMSFFSAGCSPLIIGVLSLCALEVTTPLAGLGHHFPTTSHHDYLV